jgi:outer membrane lipoprotein-sorting protein
MSAYPFPMTRKTALLLVAALSIHLIVPGQSAFAQGQGSDRELAYVLNRYFESMGGRASLERIKSARLSGKVSYPNGMTHSITVLKKKPNLVRVVLDTGTLRFIQAYDGQVAWFARESGRYSFHDRMRGSLAENFIREAPLENVLVTPGDTGVRIELGEDVTVANTLCYQVIARFPSGARIVHYIEKETFLERRIFEYDAEGKVISELVPGQFETVGGVAFAMRIIRMQDGETISTLVLDDVALNVGILDSAFSPPVELPPQ